MNRPDHETAFLPGQPLAVLTVDDSLIDAELSRHALASHGYAVRMDVVSEHAEFSRRLNGMNYDVVLSEYDLAQWNGGAVLTRLAQLRPDLPFILVTGALDDAAAAEVIDQGADDYVLKHQLGRLPLAVRRVLRERRLRAERHHALEERERLLRQLESTLAEVRRLNGLLPICVACHRFLSVQGFWSRVETYLERHTDLRISPSLCPDCTAQAETRLLN